MPGPFSVVHLFEDGDGETHFKAYGIVLGLKDFAPPADPFFVSAVEAASGFVVINLPAGWIGERHPSPGRQILFCLSGTLKLTSSDGDTRLIEAGDAFLMEDVKGKGHKSEVISNGPVKAVIVILGNSG